MSKIRDNNSDIKELTTEQKPWRAYLPNHLELLSDTSFPKIAQLLLSKGSKSPTLRAEAKELITDTLFHSLHFTDMHASTTDGYSDSSTGATTNSEKMMKFTFYHPTNDVDLVRHFCHYFSINVLFLLDTL